MNDDKYFLWVLQISAHRSLSHRIILNSVKECNRSWHRDIQIPLNLHLKQSGILLVVLRHHLRQMVHIVVSHMLLRCSSHSIMVLVNAHPVQHVFLSLNDPFNLFVWHIFLKDSLGEQIVRSMNVSLSVADLLLCSLSWGEVASPVVLRIVRVWEHVVVFDGPGQILRV